MFEAFRERGLLVLAVNAGDSEEEIREVFEKNKFSFTPVRQKEDEVSGAYGVRAYPTNYVVGPDGKVLARCVGFDEAKLRSALDEALKNKK